MTLIDGPAIDGAEREVLTARGVGLDWRRVPGDDADRLRVAMHQLATSRRSSHDRWEQQRAEDAVICLLYPPAVALANRAAGGELAPPELSRIVSAVLTRAVREASCGPASDVAERVLAVIQCRFAGPGRRAVSRKHPTLRNAVTLAHAG